MSSFNYLLWGPRPLKKMRLARGYMMHRYRTHVPMCTCKPTPPAATTRAAPAHASHVAAAPRAATRAPYFACRLGIDHAPTIDEFVAITHRQHGDRFPCGAGASGAEADPQAGKHNMITRYFCGFHAVCADLCSAAALARAKHVMATQYALVGLLEELDFTLKMMETMAPGLFAGLAAVHEAMVREGKGNARARVGDRSPRTAPNATTVAILTTWNSQDVELYRLAKDLFWRKKAVCMKIPADRSQAL